MTSLRIGVGFDAKYTIRIYLEHCRETLFTSRRCGDPTNLCRRDLIAVDSMIEVTFYYSEIKRVLISNGCLFCHKLFARVCSAFRDDDIHKFFCRIFLYSACTDANISSSYLLNRCDPSNGQIVSEHSSLYCGTLPNGMIFVQDMTKLEVLEASLDPFNDLRDSS